MSRNLLRPFGPTIAKIKIPENIIIALNDYVDKIVNDNQKTNELNYGNKLAGNVQQEFKLEKEFVIKSGWGDFLKTNALDWINASREDKFKAAKKFQLIETWMVRQFQYEYNPLHVHDGHISGVGYLKVPKSFGSTFQKDKEENLNGKLQLVHGSKMFLSPATFTITPEVGDFYFFPNYLMHVVYPFVNSNEERRSVSFNAFIDEEIYDVYKR